MKKSTERNVFLHMAFLMAIASFAVAADTQALPKNGAAAIVENAKPAGVTEKYIVYGEADGYLTVMSLEGPDAKAMSFRWPESGLKRGNVVTITATQAAKDAKPAAPKKDDLTDTFTVEMNFDGQVSTYAGSGRKLKVMSFQWLDDGIKKGDVLNVVLQVAKEADGTAKAVDIDGLLDEREETLVQAGIDEAIAEENAQRTLANVPVMTKEEESKRRNLLYLVSDKVSQAIKDAVDGKKAKPGK